MHIIERSLEVKLPTIWTDEKQSRAEAERREKIRREKSRRERVRRKKMQIREKVGKSRNTVFFQWFEAPEGRKVGSLKRRVRSHLARWEMKNSTPLWREARFEVKCTKHTMLGPLLEFPMSKKCTPLWRESHVEVKMYKTHYCRTTFGSSDVEKMHAVVARSTCRSQHVENTRGSDHFWRFRCRFAWQGQGIVHLVKSEQTWRFCSIFNYNHHYTTLHSNTLHYTTTTPSLHSTTLNSTTLHCTQLHSIKLHYTTLHYTPLHYATFHYTTFHYTSLHYTTLHSTTLQLHSTTVHYTPLHSTYTKLHYTTLHYTTLHYTAFQ